MMTQCECTFKCERPPLHEAVFRADLDRIDAICNISERIKTLIQSALDELVSAWPTDLSGMVTGYLCIPKYFIVSARDCCANTPLHMVALCDAQKTSRIIELFHHCGADLDAKNKLGQSVAQCLTPIRTKRSGGIGNKFPCLKLLVELGCKTIFDEGVLKKLSEKQKRELARFVYTKEISEAMHQNGQWISELTVIVAEYLTQI